MPQITKPGDDDVLPDMAQGDVADGPEPTKLFQADRIHPAQGAAEAGTGP